MSVQEKFDSTAAILLWRQPTGPATGAALLLRSGGRWATQRAEFLVLCLVDLLQNLQEFQRLKTSTVSHLLRSFEYLKTFHSYSKIVENICNFDLRKLSTHHRSDVFLWQLGGWGSKTHEGLSKQSGYESWEVKKLTTKYIEAFPKENVGQQLEKPPLWMTRKNVAASISFMILIGHRPQSVIFMKTFQEKLIYLTADAEEKLESFEPEMVYVIGGIVAKSFAEQHFMAKISRNQFFDIHWSYFLCLLPTLKLNLMTFYSGQSHPFSVWEMLLRVARTTKTLGQRDDRSSIVKDQRAPHFGVDRLTRLTLDMARRLDISASFLQKDMLIRVRSWDRWRLPGDCSRR